MINLTFYAWELRVCDLIEGRNVQVQKISILSSQKGLEFPGGEGGGEGYKTKKIKEMYEAWRGGVTKKIPSVGEV